MMHLTIRTPHEVQADIETLRQQISNASDLIFSMEQQSIDYRAMLADPNRGTENLVALATLREKRRALEIALEAAKEDLKGAELNEHRQRIMAERENLKTHLAIRNAAAEAALDAIRQAGHLIGILLSHDRGILQESKLQPGHNQLTDSGYLVLPGIQVLADRKLVIEWAIAAFSYQITPTDTRNVHLVEQIKESSDAVLREWDMANSTRKLGLVDYDAVQGSEEGAIAVTVDTLYDADPTEDDLAGIAELPPEQAARAMRAFANSRWGREHGLSAEPVAKA